MLLIAGRGGPRARWLLSGTGRLRQSHQPQARVNAPLVTRDAPESTGSAVSTRTLLVHARAVAAGPIGSDVRACTRAGPGPRARAHSADRVVHFCRRDCRTR